MSAHTQLTLKCDILHDNSPRSFFFFFFFNDTATTEIYTLSLHDALPICCAPPPPPPPPWSPCPRSGADRKSTRLNSSHSQSSYAVFCLKKKKHTKRLSGLNKKRKTETAQHKNNNSN